MLPEIEGLSPIWVKVPVPFGIAVFVSTTFVNTEPARTAG